MIPLTMAHVGQHVKIMSLDCGQSLNKRLCDLGLYDSTIVKVIRNDSGPIIIEVKDSKLALGRGEAQKIMIQVIAR